MAKEFKFTKQGIELIFANPSIDQYRKVRFDYKLPGIHENERDSAGFFYNATYIAEKNAFKVYQLPLNGKKYDGVLIPEELQSEIKNIAEELIEKQNVAFEQCVNDIVNGTKKITFQLIGCDYMYYSPTIKDIDPILNGLEREIIEKATTITIDDENEIIGYDYLRHLLKENIDYPKSFDVSLPEFLVDRKMKIKKEKEKQKKYDSELLTKAKLTGEKQLYNRYSTYCNDPDEECNIDIVSIYILPNGEKKIVRSHTW